MTVVGKLFDFSVAFFCLFVSNICDSSFCVLVYRKLLELVKPLVQDPTVLLNYH